jgi:hypothetical protein
MSITSITLDEHLREAGPAVEEFAALWQALWRQSRIAPERLELCRLAFARLHHDGEELAAANVNIASGLVSDACRAAVVTGQMVESDALGTGDKAMLLFAEYYWLDAQSIPDEAADAVKDHIGEAGLVLLIEALGLIDGRIRAARCLRDLKRKALEREDALVH